MACVRTKFFSFILLITVLCVSEVASRNARRHLVQRSKPLPGAPVKLQVINLERTSSAANEDEIYVGGIVDKTLKRSRRAVNPDFSPKIVRVSAV